MSIMKEPEAYISNALKETEAKLRDILFNGDEDRMIIKTFIDAGILDIDIRVIPIDRKKVKKKNE